MRFRASRWRIAALLLTLGLLAGCGASPGTSTTPAQPPAPQAAPGSATPAQPQPQPTPDFPTREITVMVPYDPGGGFDVYARGIAPYLEKHLPRKVSVVVQNLPGAGGETGATALYRAEPNGYTIGMMNMPGLVVPQMKGTAKFELEKYTWLGRIAAGVQVIAIAPKSGFKTFADLQQAGRKIKIGTAGLSSSAGMSTVIMINKTKLNAQAIPYTTGSKEAALAAIRGEIDAIQFPYDTVRQYFESGELIPALIFSDKPPAELPNLTTGAAMGYGALTDVLMTHYLLAGPPGLPTPVAKILQEAVAKAMADPEFIAWANGAKRPLDALNAAGTDQAVRNTITTFAEYKDILLQK